MRVFTRVTSEIDTGRIISCESYEYDGPVELCRGEDQKAWNKSQIAKSNAGLNVAGGYGTAATNADPTAAYKGIVSNPMSSEERAGVLSGVATPYEAAGEKAGERMAATRNSAGYGSILDELARARGRAVGTTAAGLDTEAFNRKMEALKGLQGVYGTNVGAQTNLLRPNQPVSEPGFWDQFVLTAMGNANQAARAAATGGG